MTDGPLRVIIAGSRCLRRPGPVIAAIQECGFDIGEVVCGGALGVDSIGETWAVSNGVPVTRIRAEWDRYGKKAGPIRNRQMAEQADALILVWNGQSAGSKNMLHEARKRGLLVFEEIVEAH